MKTAPYYRITTEDDETAGHVRLAQDETEEFRAKLKDGFQIHRLEESPPEVEETMSARDMEVFAALMQMGRTCGLSTPLESVVNYLRSFMHSVKYEDIPSREREVYRAFAAFLRGTGAGPGDPVEGTTPFEVNLNLGSWHDQGCVSFPEHFWPKEARRRSSSYEGFEEKDLDDIFDASQS